MRFCVFTPGILNDNFLQIKALCGCMCNVMAVLLRVCVHAWQTPSTGLRHPSTTAVFSYAIGSRKLSVNEQFFVAQTVAGLLQTTHIKRGVSFIAANKVYTSTNKTTIV